MKIHSLASIDPKARIAPDCEIGPFCVIGPDVTLGAGNRLLNNVTILGRTTVGKNNTFFPNSVIGAVPQDLKYKGGPCELSIGDNNRFRESVTIHIGTEDGGGVTRIGSGNLLMVNVHIAHDVQMGDGCIIANNAMFAGHILCGNHVAVMGAAGIHHYVTIGDYAYLGGAARVHHDVPPFVKIDGADKIRGINVTGLQRAGFNAADITALDEACRRLFYGKEKPFAQAMADFDTENGINPHVKQIIEALRRRDSGKNGRYLESLRAKK